MWQCTGYENRLQFLSTTVHDRAQLMSPLKVSPSCLKHVSRYARRLRSIHQRYPVELPPHLRPGFDYIVHKSRPSLRNMQLYLRILDTQQSHLVLRKFNAQLELHFLGELGLDILEGSGEWENRWSSLGRSLGLSTASISDPISYPIDLTCRTVL